MHIPEIVVALCSLFRAAGGRAMLVGGSVVDSLRGVEPSDWDVEVYNLSVPAVERTLEEGGFVTKTAGQEFGVFKLRRDQCSGLDVDVSIPRRDNSIGVCHKDFRVDMVPKATEEEAAKRRDFTINSIYIDPETMLVVDPYGGVKDLEDRVLRATDPATFVEDPLRVLRAAQFLSRGKAIRVTRSTRDLCASMRPDHLSAERVLGEYNKLLMGEMPSRGLKFLWGINWLPEVLQVQAVTKEHPCHHEDNVWEHTLRVVDNAALIRDRLPEEDRLVFMWAALLHDVGKPLVTDGEGNAIGHDQAGVEPTRDLLGAMKAPKKGLVERVVPLVQWHMQPYGLTRGEAKDGAWKRLYNRVQGRLDLLGWLSRCDGSATHDKDVVDNSGHRPSLNCWSHHERLVEEGSKVLPLLQGRDLIDVGLKPGPSFKPRLDAAYEAQLDNPELGIKELIEVALAAT